MKLLVSQMGGIQDVGVRHYVVLEGSNNRCLQGLCPQRTTHFYIEILHLMHLSVFFVFFEGMIKYIICSTSVQV